jgi:hypothetical protein
MANGASAAAAGANGGRTVKLTGFAQVREGEGGREGGEGSTGVVSEEASVGDRLKRRARVVAGAGTYVPVCVERRSRRREGGDEEGREGGQGG